MDERKLEVVEMPVDSLKPNNWNTNVVTPENEAKIQKSIRRFGIFKPIITRNVDGGFQEIIGGEHRWQVARKMGYENVPVLSLGDVDDKTAKEIGLVDNGRYGEDDGLQLSELLRSIGTVDEISSFLPYSGSEMKDMFRLTDSIKFEDLEIEDSSEDVLETEEPSPAKTPKTHATLKFTIPAEDYLDVRTHIEQIIRDNGFDEGSFQNNAGCALLYLLRNDS